VTYGFDLVPWSEAPDAWRPNVNFNAQPATSVQAKAVRAITSVALLLISHAFAAAQP
jgi:hypothetical protein